MAFIRTVIQRSKLPWAGGNVRGGTGVLVYPLSSSSDIFLLRLVIAFGFFSINIFVLLIHTVPFLTDAGLSRNEASFAMLVASIPAMISKPSGGTGSTVAQRSPWRRFPLR